jgi:hypothetical protein
LLVKGPGEQGIGNLEFDDSEIMSPLKTGCLPVNNSMVENSSNAGKEGKREGKLS